MFLISQEGDNVLNSLLLEQMLLVFLLLSPPQIQFSPVTSDAHKGLFGRGGSGEELGGASGQNHCNPRTNELKAAGLLSLEGESRFKKKKHKRTLTVSDLPLRNTRELSLCLICPCYGFHTV
jgi:hypothetical protein